MNKYDEKENEREENELFTMKGLILRFAKDLRTQQLGSKFM